MREILFKGFYECENGETVITVSGNQKRGKWVEGDLSHTKIGQSFILENLLDTGYDVIPETICQYTGLTDKNGKRIFEGDILKDKLDWVYEVRWDNDGTRFLGFHSKPRGDTYVCYVRRNTIIGNIFDNPELLEV